MPRPLKRPPEHWIGNPCNDRFCMEGDVNIKTIAGLVLEQGTGWDVPPGVLHAPGSFYTYEPQEASDVFAIYQSFVGDQVLPGQTVTIRNNACYGLIILQGHGNPDLKI